MGDCSRVVRLSQRGMSLVRSHPPNIKEQLMTDTTSLAGRAAIVTGAGRKSGMGRAIALAMAAWSPLAGKLL